LKNYEVSGAGTVGLGTRMVDYRVTPVALRANSGQGVSIPVDFTGPWSNISIRPDLEAALDSKFEEEKDALEKKAKQKLSKELGLSGERGTSIEDQIKDRVLRKLFD
jgi:AsmA protein